MMFAALSWFCPARAEARPGRSGQRLHPGWALALGALLAASHASPVLAQHSSSDLRRLEREALAGRAEAHREAVRSLATAGEAAVPHLIRLVERGTLPVRLVALNELKKLGPAGKDSLGPVLGLLGAPTSIPGDLRMGIEVLDLDLRGTLVSITLEVMLKAVEIGGDDELIADYDRTLALCIVHGLAKADPGSTLEALARDRRRERNAREGNDEVLLAFAGGIRAAETPPVELLVERLGAREVLARHLALAGLAALGEQARAARPALVPLLADRDRAIAIRAAEALATIGGSCEGTRPGLQPLLEGRDLRARAIALGALLAAHPGDGEALAALLELTGHRDAAASAAALLGLASLGDPSPPFLAALETQLVHPDVDRRLTAARALIRLGSAGQPLASVAQVQLRAEEEGSPVIKHLRYAVEFLRAAG
jgi:hypothetical protein